MALSVNFENACETYPAADDGFFANSIVSLVEVSSASSMVSAIAKAVNFTFSGTSRAK